MLKLIHGLPTVGKSHVVSREISLSNTTFSFVYDSDSFDAGIPGLTALRDSDLKDLFINKQVEQQFNSHALRKYREKNIATMLSSLISLNGTVLALTNCYIRNLVYDISFIVEPDVLLKRWQDRKTLSSMTYEIATQWVSYSMVWARKNNVLQVMLRKDQYLSDCLSFYHRDGMAIICLTNPMFVNLPLDFEHIHIVSNGVRMLKDRKEILRNFMWKGLIESENQEGSYDTRDI